VQACDLQLQSARQRIAAQIGREATLQAEHRALSAVIDQQSSWMELQAEKSEEDRDIIAGHEACMHAAIEEMEMMCLSSRSATEAVR
jgi:hypothetical protein